MRKLYRKLFVAEGTSDLENLAWAVAFSFLAVFVFLSLNQIITGFEWLFGVHF